METTLASTSWGSSAPRSAPSASTNKSATGSCYDAAKAAPYNSAKVNYIQFRYVDYTTGYSGSGGDTCKFTDPTCTYAILSAQLYK